MRTIGSQIRETLAESEYTLLLLLPKMGEAILQTSEGKRERWFKHDDHAGYTVEINGVGYEFASSVI